MASSSKFDSSPDESSAFSVKDIYFILLEKIWIVGACVIFALLVAGVYILRSPTLYTSKVVVEVEQGEQKVMNFQEVTQENLGSQEVLRTIEQNLNSSAVLSGLVLRNKLNLDAEVLQARGANEISEAGMISLLNSRVDVSLRKGTRLIDVQVDSEDPKLAQRLATLLVSEAIRVRIAQRANASAMATQFLIEEASKQKQKLNQSELALQDYKEKFGTVSLEERQDTVTQTLKELNMSLTEVNSERIRLESQVEEAKRNKDNPESLKTLAGSMNDPAAQDIRNRISEQESVIGGLVQRYKEKHPKMIQARSQLKELNESLKRLVSPERLQYAYETARAKEKSFEIALKKQETEALELNRKLIDYNVLSREVETDRTMYEAVSTRLKQTTLAQGLENSDIRINEPASLPTKPSKPKKTIILGIGLFAGVILGVIIIFALYFINDSFKTVDQVENVLHLPVLGALPEDSQNLAEDGSDSNRLIVETEKNSPLTESFRSLRVTLGLLGREKERKVFLFTSAIPAEGKSFVCANLGATFAQQGLKTLIIDADLRKPRLSSIFDLSKSPKGVVTYLTAQSKLSDLVTANLKPNLDVLPCGPQGPNPAELLSGPHFSALIQEASKTYDRIIVDTAPIHAVSDTLLLVEFVQSICLVVRAGKTPQNAVIRAIEILRRAQANPVGIILNRLPLNKGAGYYYYYSHYEGYGDPTVASERPQDKIRAALKKLKSK